MLAPFSRHPKMVPMIFSLISLTGLSQSAFIHIIAIIHSHSPPKHSSYWYHASLSKMKTGMNHFIPLLKTPFPAYPVL